MSALGCEDAGGASPSSCEVSRIFLFICLSGGLRDKFFLAVFFSPNPKEEFWMPSAGPIIPVFTVARVFGTLRFEIAVS